MKQIILASRSADRYEILDRAKVSFKTIITNVNEDQFKSKISNPIELATTLAKEKAKTAKEMLLEEYSEAIIIAADTIVELNGEIIGKAEEETSAFQILKKMTGKTHNLITGIAVTEINSNRMISDYESTKVSFATLSDEEIWNYVKTREWIGRAGAYSILDKASLFITSIEGSSSNIIGLPMNKVFEILKNHFDLNLFDDIQISDKSL